MPIRLYVGNLPKDLDRQELEAAFAEAGDLLAIKVITDRKTNKCRGFGFITVKSDEEADEVIEKFNGYQVKDCAIKIEKALPRSKGKEEGSAPAAPSAAGGARRKGGSGSGGGGKARRSTTSTTSDAVQPDPRWAQDLEKLKELLAAQTTTN